MKFENIKITGFSGALRGMRNPKNSWHLSDSQFYIDSNGCEHPLIGCNDLGLAIRLANAGSCDRKFLRQIFVSMDITCPAYFAAELDTYKVGTVRNSCSLQHKGASRDFTIDDFTIDDKDIIELFHNVGYLNEDSMYSVETLSGFNCWKILLYEINKLRKKFVETKDYSYFRQMRQLIPQSYNYKFTFTCTYENLSAMCSKYQRRFHKLKEWSGNNPAEESFLQMARSLPYAQELIFTDELQFPEIITEIKEGNYTPKDEKIDHSQMFRIY